MNNQIEEILRALEWKKNEAEKLSRKEPKSCEAAPAYFAGKMQGFHEAILEIKRGVSEGDLK